MTFAPGFCTFDKKLWSLISMEPLEPPLDLLAASSVETKIMSMQHRMLVYRLKSHRLPWKLLNFMNYVYKRIVRFEILSLKMYLRVRKSQALMGTLVILSTHVNIMGFSNNLTCTSHYYLLHCVSKHTGTLYYSVFSMRQKFHKK